jgi:mRNA-degrading endonuclease toxin of MazEF toxin-antitoxin module
MPTTPPTTRFEFGDVVVVPFPFSDQNTTKQRPAVVVSSSSYQAQRPDLILLAVTSQAHARRRRRPAVQEAGLLKPSVFKPVLTTIEKRLVRRKLGRLLEEDRRALQGLLGTILGL